jgi:hypothetical protein
VPVDRLGIEPNLLQNDPLRDQDGSFFESVARGE